MTKKEIITRIEAGQIMKEWFGTKSNTHEIGGERVTSKQFKAALDHFGDKLDFTADYSGFTKHYYKIKDIYR